MVATAEAETSSSYSPSRGFWALPTLGVELAEDDGAEGGVLELGLGEAELFAGVSGDGGRREDEEDGAAAEGAQEGVRNLKAEGGGHGCGHPRRSARIGFEHKGDVVVDEGAGEVLELHGVELAGLDVEGGNGLGVADDLGAGGHDLGRGGRGERGEAAEVGELDLVVAEAEEVDGESDFAGGRRRRRRW